LARFLALDWDHRHLVVVSAVVKNGSIRIQKATAWETEQNPQTGAPDALGRLLRDRLREAGIAPAPVLACIGRDRVILKDIRHPPATAAEEPAVVRFQVVRELNDPAEQVVIDYMPSTEPVSSGERRALAVVLRRNILVNYQNVCRAAGLKLAALAPRPFGAAACLSQFAGLSSPGATAEAATVAILTVGDAWAEFTVVRGGALLFGRSLTTGPSLAAEVRRNLAVFAGQATQNPIRAIYVTGGREHAGLRQQLHELLHVSVHPLDPFAGIEQPGLPADNRGLWTGAVGLLHARSQGKDLPINFVTPREPKPVTSPNRNRILIGAAAAVAVLVGLVGFGIAEMSRRDDEIGRLTQEKADVDAELFKLDEDVKRVKALEEWQQGDVVWLDELYDLTHRFPDLTKVRATKLLFSETANRTAKDKDKYAAKISVTGIGKDWPSMSRLATEVLQDGHYRVPESLSPTRNPSRTLLFPYQFTLKYDVEKIPPAKYTRRFTIASESAEDSPGTVTRPPRRGNRPNGAMPFPRRQP
jgi:Tfp pilus assembly PilM family ATPase